MNTKGSFQLDCISCKTPVLFSLIELESPSQIVSCSECGKKYGFGQEPLRRQLHKFAALCLQIKESEEILGNASVAVDIGSSHTGTNSVKIPFKLLLTRLKSTLDLTVDGEKFLISFRVEPTATK